MDLQLSEEQELIVGMVRRFVREEIVPLELDLDPDADRLGEEDRERLIGTTRAMGLYGLDIPPEYGGPEIDLVTRTLIAIELSQHRAGLYAPCYGVFGGAGLAQLFEATDQQKERYLYPTLRGEKRGFFGLTEPSGGSDPARAIQTRAERDGDDWIINGGKIFISGADKADFGLVFARTDKERGRNGVTCFIVDTDTEGFHVRRVVHTLRSAHYATELQFDDMRVPAANILGELNRGFAIANDRLSRQRIPYAAGCVGVAIKAHEMALEYVPVRETFGAPLSSRQAIQWMLVDNEIDIKQSRWVTLEAASRAERGEDFRKEAAMAKLVATEAASRVVDRCMQMFGGYGVTKDFPFERWYREMRIRRIGEGPNEIQRHIIARDILGASLR
ncbi:MAG: acyl-CoA dehydrogenase family protein [Pseudomonadales bacterium]|jgi:alkylation response protein AidB-like acyl-CoA dehydrogenase|nr:acyl-CoA dehydrogenase family protein [Pseudomonadales bacterium]MDP6470539.1 acyl-CoA dehydrogenase family protein [Pseudomonadales bacterium]MDP6827841.1 acyl-CoA dehydrogenase family protein [Pseudomonadales bacterium]MDP6972173.1 acyl-CoA dehydrogenase family protein [Pseudomonadales bacterium]